MTRGRVLAIAGAVSLALGLPTIGHGAAAASFRNPPTVVVTLPVGDGIRTGVLPVVLGGSSTAVRTLEADSGLAFQPAEHVIRAGTIERVRARHTQLGPRVAASRWPRYFSP